MDTLVDADIAACIGVLLRQRAADASICPSEVARALCADEDGWRAAMPQVRRVAAALAARDVLRVTQGNRELGTGTVEQAVGPIRLRRGAAFAELP